MTEQASAAAICRVDELDGYANAGFSHVVSILDPGYAVPDTFARFAPHQRLDLRFHDIIDPQPEMVPPGRDHIEQLVQFGRAIAASPAPVRLLSHCQAAVSRSTAAAIVLLATARPAAPGEAVTALLAAAPNAWPNLRIIELGDAVLGHGGALVAAVRLHYADMLARYPALRELVAVDRHLHASLGVD